MSDQKTVRDSTANLGALAAYHAGPIAPQPPQRLTASFVLLLAQGTRDSLVDVGLILAAMKPFGPFSVTGSDANGYRVTWDVCGRNVTAVHSDLRAALWALLAMVGKALGEALGEAEDVSR